MNIVKPSTLNNTGLTDADLVGMKVTVKGMNTTNTFDLSTSRLGDTPDTEGNEYPYDVTITRTGVQANGTIRPWTNNSRPPATAE